MVCVVGTDELVAFRCFDKKAVHLAGFVGSGEEHVGIDETFHLSGLFAGRFIKHCAKGCIVFGEFCDTYAHRLGDNRQLQK